MHHTNSFNWKSMNTLTSIAAHWFRSRHVFHDGLCPVFFYYLFLAVWSHQGGFCSLLLLQYFDFNFLRITKHGGISSINGV